MTKAVPKEYMCTSHNYFSGQCPNTNQLTWMYASHNQ